MDYIFAGILKAFGLLFKGDPETYAAVWTTVSVSSLSIFASLLIGIPLGFLLARSRFPGKRAVRTVVDTLLSFPTVVIGLLVYAFISRQGMPQTRAEFCAPGLQGHRVPCYTRQSR